MAPPRPAAASHNGNEAGRVGIVAHVPASAAAEFRRLKAAVTAAARRVSTHPIRRISGARNMPPPVPVTPERKPMHAPLASAGSHSRPHGAMGEGHCISGRAAAEQKTTTWGSESTIFDYAKTSSRAKEGRSGGRGRGGGRHLRRPTSPLQTTSKEMLRTTQKPIAPRRGQRNTIFPICQVGYCCS